MMPYPQRKLPRLKGYYYSQANRYFVTICTQNRQPCFGDVVDGVMELNAAGHVAAACRLAIPSHFAAVILHAQVVMPNHVHGLIDLLPSADVALTVSVIVGSFKSAVTRFTNQMGIVTPRPLWQYSFHDHHDHIVRDERSFEQIYEYVRNNPQKWHEDRLYHATDMQS